MLTQADRRRRWFGLFFLGMAVLLLIWGQTILEPLLKGLGYIVYWLACMLFTALAALTGWLDVRAIRQRMREQQRQLWKASFGEDDRGDGQDSAC